MRMKEGESGFTLLVEGNTMRDEGSEARGINSLRYPGTEWTRLGDLTINVPFPCPPSLISQGPMPGPTFRCVF